MQKQKILYKKLSNTLIQIQEKEKEIDETSCWLIFSFRVVLISSGETAKKKIIQNRFINNYASKACWTAFCV
jgi:hypothetical protein